MPENPLPERSRAGWRRRIGRCARAGSTLCLSALILAAGGCASGPPKGAGTPPAAAPRPVASVERDGPGAHPPGDLARVPDAVPQVEPIRVGGPNRPYEALGRNYVPLAADLPFAERGLASWYGRKFHGRRTSSGEPYDMYAMTAAHPTLPIPSYARVRNPANGREVVVRINDRGPFHAGRIVDLSYTAAFKLDLLRGVAPVELERIVFDDIRTGAWRRSGDDAARLARHDATAPAGATAALPVPRVSAAMALASTAPQSLPLSVPVPASASASELAPPAASTAGGVGDPTAAASPPRISAAPGTSPATPMTPATAPETGGDRAASLALAPAPASAAEGVSARLALAPAESAPSSPVSVTAAPGHWVQLGAFRARDGAEAFQRRVAAELEWLSPQLAVVGDAQFYRLQAGPYPSRQAAREAAERVRETLQLVPTVVERR